MIADQIAHTTNLAGHLPGVLAALASAASWAVGTLLFKGIGAEFSAAAMTLVKSFFSVLLLSLALILVGYSSMSASSFAWLIASGVVGIAAGDTFFFAALRLLPVHQLVVLMMLAPAVTLLMAICFLDEAPTPVAWLGIILILAGVSLTSVAGLHRDSRRSTAPRGLVFGILAVLCMGGSVVIAKIGLVSVPALQATLVRMIAGFFGMVILLLGRRQMKESLAPLQRWTLRWQFIAAVTVVTFGGFWLSLFAIKSLDVSIANTLLATEPLFALPLSVVCLRERPVALAWGGALVAFPGALLLALA